MYTNLSHVEPPPIPLVKEMSTSKSYGDYVKLKLLRDPMSSTSDLYELRMSSFEHGGPEEFIFFVRNFQMTLADTGTLETEAKVQYLRTFVCGEALLKFDLVSSDTENTETLLYVDYILKDLAWYFFS